MHLSPADVALVTGGGSGLGAATARRLHDQGANVVLVDLESSKGADLAAELGDRARFVPADVRDEDQLGAAVTAATELGTLRVAVCCAGIAPGARILGRKGLHPLQLFKDTVEINLVGTFNTLRLAAQAMAENEPLDADRGLVVMTASVAAFEGQLGQSAYSASKGGVAALTIQAARDLADKAIRVDTIAPGTMETPMMAAMSDAVKDSLAAGIPHPSRLGKPEEYAGLVAHLVENGLINGEIIRLDGALRMPPR